MRYKSDVIVALATLLAIAGTFSLESMFSLGTAVWVLYALPLALTYASSRPWLPLMAAAASLICIPLGFLRAQEGIDPHMAMINRSLGAFIIIVLGVVGFMLVRNRMNARKLTFVQNGQVTVAQATQGDLTPAAAGDKLLTALAELLKARAAVAYIRGAEGYQRIAAWGVDETQVPAEVRSGQGHLWRAAVSNDIVVQQGSRDSTLAWSTGLMHDRPAWSVILPTHDGVGVNGLIEIGLDEKPDQARMLLLENLSGSIGVSFRSARYREQLQELLEETRRQAEELRSHTEELASTNEELEEQTQALLLSRQQLEQQQSDLEEHNAKLEIQAQQLEEQRDALVASRHQLAEQAAQLGRASRYKSEFVANMSHELRTPLNALLIMARLLGENRTGNLNADQIKWADTISNAGQDLLGLINDILDLSKIEAGKLEVQPTRVEPKNVAQRLHRAFEQQAANKGLGLHIDVQDEALQIVTDPVRLEQILRNFMSNAIKFTHRGAVTLRVKRSDGGVSFAVEDTGIGIDANDQKGVFEAFQQADGTISRKYGGTGLGLSISRELAELLGGHITLESVRDKGSVFTLHLPERLPGATSHALEITAPRALSASAMPAPARLAAQMPDVSGDVIAVSPGIHDDRDVIGEGDRIILVVEDDAVFAQVLLDLARELKFRGIVVGSAEDAVRAARRYLPQAIVLDVGLPDHSGLSVLDRLKRDVHTRHIPIHVVSAGDHMREALAQGAMSYLLKPVDRDALVHTIQRLDSHYEDRNRRVLIVEDDPAQLAGLRALLGSDTVETVGASTAAEAMAACRAGTFDCIVLDMTLPDASGFDVLEQLDADEAASFPPVIVYTARALSEAEELRLRRYSRSIIIKGAKSPERLIDEVTLFLHQVVAGLPERQREMLKVSLNRDAVLEGRRILVVEDDIRNVYALTGILEPHGVDVQVARNGREALEALGRAADSASPAIDLVLMDVMMPEMDGITATREIRGMERWKSLPIIMLTAKAMADDQNQCLEAGANDYIPKPIDVDKLLSLARVWVSR